MLNYCPKRGAWSGFKLLKVLRKNIPALAVVMLSDSELNRIDAVHAGISDYLLKPVSRRPIGRRDKVA